MGKIADKVQITRDSLENIAKQVKELEKDYGEARATILVNFGPDGHQIPGIVTEDMSLVGMVIHLGHQIKDLQERLYDGG